MYTFSTTEQKTVFSCHLNSLVLMSRTNCSIASGMHPENTRHWSGCRSAWWQTNTISAHYHLPATVHRLQNDLNCVEWDVKPCSTNQASNCPSICPAQVSNLETKRHRKTQTAVNFPQGRGNRHHNFQLRRSKSRVGIRFRISQSVEEVGWARFNIPLDTV